MPFLGSLLRESIRYAKQEDPDADRKPQSHQGLLHSTRTSMWLLDDKRESSENILQKAE